MGSSDAPMPEQVFAFALAMLTEAMLVCPEPYLLSISNQFILRFIKF